MSSLTIDPNSYILLVKTDENFTFHITNDLKSAGYSTVLLSDVSKVLHQVQTLQPAMVVFDYNLTGQSGLKFCRELRVNGQTIPILMLIEQATLSERVACLESGADDYLLKPYQSQEFLRILNLYLQPNEKNKEQLRFGDLILDLSTRRLIRNGQNIDLTMKEFELLKYLMSHSQETLTREQILENVWGYDFRGESNVIEVYIRYLRLKIETEGQKRLIHTVRGVGYALRDT